ncbi:MAG: hypothetical protein LBC99_01925 [Spirochaetota bacterium]|jgi:hypothetical protein|nr:hypothetical protein [Spirochaetota bacterium]
MMPEATMTDEEYDLALREGLLEVHKQKNNTDWEIHLWGFCMGCKQYDRKTDHCAAFGHKAPLEINSRKTGNSCAHYKE